MNAANRSVFTVEMEGICDRGGGFGPEEVSAAQERLATSSADVEARALLLGALPREDQYGHIRWFIQNAPAVHLGPYGLVFPDEGVIYDDLKTLWLATAGERASDLQVLSNAAWFFLLSDPAIGESLYTTHGRGNVPEEELSAHLTHFYEFWLSSLAFDKAGARTVAKRALASYSAWLRVAEDKPRLLRSGVLWKMRDVARNMTDPSVTQLLRLADMRLRESSDDPSAIEVRAIIALCLEDASEAKTLFGLLQARPDVLHEVLSALSRAGFAERVRDLAGICTPAPP
jgi:hypothetical protein